LLYSTDGSFNYGVQSIFLQLHFSPDALDPFSPGCDEIQVTPVAPLQSGYYQLILTGIGHLGSNATDTTIPFHIGSGEADDVTTTAHDLGDLTHTNLTQQSGAVGDDPYYAFFDPNHNDPLAPDYSLPTNYAGADVDFYHFTIAGPGSFILLSEAFAGRIGSPLDAGLSLFKLVGNQLVLVGGNDSTQNNTLAFGDNGYFGTPLFTDPFLNAGVSAGDYFLVVSSGRNTPDALVQQFVGDGVVFDPTQSHSGSSGASNQNGFTVGGYVLNVRVAPNPGAPHVVSVSPGSSAQPIPSPTQIVVRFNQAVNLQQEAFAAYQTSGGNTLRSVFVH